MLKAAATQDEDPGAESSGRPGSRTFSMQFTSSARGARLARRLAVRRMEEWGYGPASDASCHVALLVGELAANAVCHGRVRGRDFRLRLGHAPDAETVLIEVSDASPQRPPASPAAPEPDDESGRGLLLVDVLAAGWGVTDRGPIGKTVWAEVRVASHGACLNEPRRSAR